MGFFARIIQRTSSLRREISAPAPSRPPANNEPEEDEAGPSGDPPAELLSSGSPCASPSRAACAPEGSRRRGVHEGSGRAYRTPAVPRNVAGVAIRRSVSLDPLALLEARLSVGSRVSDCSDHDSGVLGGTYRALRNVCNGSNCTVIEAMHRKTLTTVIIKSVPKSRMTETTKERLNSEVDFLKLAAANSVPHLVRLIERIEDDTHMYTVLEQAPGVSLIEHMANRGGRIQHEGSLRKIARALLLAVDGLHSLGIVHRHLKPEHVMCSIDDVVTVLDLTDAASKTLRCLNNRIGELAYMAPEVLSKPRAEEVFLEVIGNGMAEEELPQYDEKADIWSVGAVLFEAVTGQQPFLAETAAEMLQVQATLLNTRTADNMPTFIASHIMPDRAKAFLSELFQLDPAKRPSASSLLSHPWLHPFNMATSERGTLGTTPANRLLKQLKASHFSEPRSAPQSQSLL